MPEGQPENSTSPADVIRERAVLASRALTAGTRPLFRATSRGEPELIGSCVLLRIGEVCFLISAAHCFDEDEGAETHRLFVGAAGRLVEVEGVGMETQLPASGDRRDDRYDVAFVQLSHAAIEGLDGCEFFTLDDLDPYDSPNQNSGYLLVGYPWRRSRLVREETRVHYEALIYAGLPAPFERHAAIGTDPSSHYLVGFRRDRVIGASGYTTAPRPEGVSGSGLWRFHSVSGIESNRRPEKLVGIVIEYWSDQHVLVATRISVVLELITQRHPELRSIIDGW